MSNRREFLTTATTLAAASSLAPHTFAQNENGKKKLGYALVGLGRLSTNQIAPALQKTEHSELVGIVTGSPEKAEQWQGKYGIEKKNTYNYRNFDKIVDNPNIDIVYVVLPNSMHEEFTIRAARAGKHVLCEKPMSVSSDESRQMIAECDKANVKLAIGYRCQFEPHHLECMRLAKEETYGKLRHIDAGFGFRFGDYPLGDLRRWRLEMEYAGGGALMDVGVYALQACRYLTGEEPINVSAREVKTDEVKFAEVDETILWNMEFPSGVVASCSTTYKFSGVNFFKAYCDKGQFGLGPAYSYGGTKGTAGNKPLELKNIDQFAAEMDDFSKVVKSNGTSKVSGVEGLRDMLVVDAIYKSIKTGKKTKVKKV